MANENTCVRCGKPCAPGEVMCPACDKWLSENAAAEKPKAPPAQKPASAVKHCVHCDGMIPAVAQFCPHCGQSQGAAVKKAAPIAAPVVKPAEKSVPRPSPKPAAAPAAKAAQPRQTIAEKKQEKAKSGQKGLIIGLIVLILLLLAALAVMLWLGLSDSGPSVKDRDESESADREEDSEEESGEGSLGVFEPGDGIVAPDPEAPAEPEGDAPVQDETEDQETEQEEAPAAVACRKCGVAITTDMEICPYCEWDQSVDPETVPDEPLSASVGYIDAFATWEIVPVSETSETSIVSQSGNYDNSAAVTVDGDLSTSWQEGVDGYGIGESIRLDFDGEHQVCGFTFWLGNWRGDSWYAENGVPKLLNIYIGDTVLTVEFPHEKECQYVALSEPVTASYVMFEISSAYEGSKYDDTCIAEIKIHSDPA